MTTPTTSSRFPDGTRIFLVRHAQSLGNIDLRHYHTYSDPGIPLTPLGHCQARDTAHFFKTLYDTTPATDRSIRLWHSPYRRAAETAAWITHALGSKESGGLLDTTRSDPRLREQAFGLFEGLTEPEQRALAPDAWNAIQPYFDNGQKFFAPFHIVGGESPAMVLERVRTFLDTLSRDIETHGPMDIIIVTHGATLRALTMAFDKSLDATWYHQEPNPANAAIRLIQHENGRFHDKGYLHTPAQTLANPSLADTLLPTTAHTTPTPSLAA